MENGIIFDYIIVGSGPSGAISAHTLTKSKANILMLDVGNKDELYNDLVPVKDYESIRKSEKEQNRFFLGDNMEAIPDSNIKVGAQLSPSRKAMIKDVQEFIPLLSDNFTPMESLGYGGLGAGWGLGTYVYSEAELRKVGLPIKEMMKSYQETADIIGVSAGEDDIRPFVLGRLQNIQKAVIQDISIQKLFNKYNKNHTFFSKNRMYFGASAMAILTENKDDRKATSYSDMDFYTDKEKSAFRPQFIIDKLKSKSNFEYISNRLVLSFSENNNIVEVRSINPKNKKVYVYKAKKLILSSGNLGTARIVLRSFPSINKLPLLSNSYSYLPGINISMLGKKLDSRKSSMAQAMMIYEPDGIRMNL
jgi:hypothetical protein